MRPRAVHRSGSGRVGSFVVVLCTCSPETVFFDLKDKNPNVVRSPSFQSFVDCAFSVFNFDNQHIFVGPFLNQLAQLFHTSTNYTSTNYTSTNVTFAGFCSGMVAAYVDRGSPKEFCPPDIFRYAADAYMAAIAFDRFKSSAQRKCGSNPKVLIAKP